MADQVIEAMFNSQCELKLTEVRLIEDFDNLWLKYTRDTALLTFPDEYYAELKEIADKYEVPYTEPRFRMGLQGVGTTVATIH